MLTSTHGNPPAKVRYLDGNFRLLTHGDHVVCAVTGHRIALTELKYWSVARQEAYCDAAASLEASKAD